jgi:FtsP/CotA-like multicopper oxidase with cupredoxin domain
MKIKLTKNALASTIALSLMSATYSGASFAIDYYLCAKQGNITMSDGTVVPMWGFAPDTTIEDPATGVVTKFANNCTDPIQVPGPALRVPDSDGELNIHVRNVDLSEPVSIVIPGQALPKETLANGAIIATVPVMLPSDTSRVRSFTHETAVGTDRIYTWSNVKAGTYAYQSGTHPAVQVQMGLYGAMIKNQQDAVDAVTLAQAYGPSTAYGSELTVFYSEIDTVLHNQVADGSYGTTGMTSTMDYNPQYFLANADDSSTGELDVGELGQTTLIRFINMGLKSHIPTIHGDSFAVIAEDGYPYQYPRNQYSVQVAAGQTRDVLLTLPPLDLQNPFLTYTMFDRMLNLTEGSRSIVTAAAGGSTLTSPGSLVTVLGTNADADNVLDYRDNCLLVTNTNQRDTNGDGFGNICDADLDNNGTVGFSDFTKFRAAFGSTNPDADFDGDGSVGFSDFTIFRSSFGSAPGPSGTTN